MQVTKEEYMDFFKGQDLKPISNFSDMDGVLRFGYGCPAMDTDWGIEGKVMARCEMRKKSRHDKDWECTYYIYVEGYKRKKP